MIPKPLLTKFRSKAGQSLVAVLCVLSLVPGKTALRAQEPAAAPEQAASKIPDDQLDALVAPIALYPDALLSQTLVASTYPLEMIQLQQWLEKHKDLKGDALVAAVKKEHWDPSIQSMAALPDAVKQLAGNIQWTTDLGNAFLAQQSDVMDAVQRMRAKANAAGNLKSNAQMKVETRVVETKTVVVIEQANPKVVYVPSYNPVVVYGPPVYPYPPIYYPPPATGAILAFGAGVAVGAIWGGGGGWGYNCGWGSSNTVKVNVNNNYNYNYNKANINNRPSTLPAGGSSNWQHNPQHRGAAPYSNKATTTQYARGTTATAQTSRGGAAAGVSTKYGNTAVGQTASGKNYAVHNGNVYTGSGNASNSGNAGANRQAGGSNAGANQQAAGGSNAGANRQVGGSNAGANRQAGSNNIGGHSPSAGGGGGAFGGGGMGGSSAKAASSRGSHSMGGGGFGGGGQRGGGGGRSGAGRGRR